MKVVLVIYLITIAIYLIGFIYSMQVTRTVLDGKKVKKWRGTRFICSVMQKNSREPILKRNNSSSTILT